MESTHCGIRHDHVCFLLSTKRHSTSDNSCCTSSFGHADRAISIISMTPRYDPICFGVACRTRGILRNSLYSGGCRGPKAIDSFSNSILGDAHNFLTHTTKKHKMFTAVVHKDADHTRTFHCCRGAVEYDRQRSAGRLNYHACDLVATRADFELKFSSHSNISRSHWSRPLAARNFMFVNGSKIWSWCLQTGIGKRWKPRP